MALSELLGNFRNRSSADSTVRSSTPIGSAERLRLLDIYEQSGQGWFWASDTEGRLTYISRGICDLLDTALDDILGCPVVDIFTVELDEMEGQNRPFNFLLAARNSIVELPVKAPVKDKEIWWSISGRPVFDDAGRFEGYAGHGKDVTLQRRERQDAARLAEFDSLTGLANRHRMARRLTSILTAYKAAQRSCALMMLDLDRFKQINDTMGHPAGDELLKQVAQRLDRIVAKQGEIGRLGGDEFQVILPDLDDRGQLGDIAARIIQMLSQPYTIDGVRCTIGASIGVAIAPYDGLDSDQLVRSADLALYSAKGGGRGQYRFYSSELKDEAEERRLIEDDLRDALAHGELTLNYQPIVRIEDNIVVGFEALMRWNHPERGLISPAVFIPIAEDSHLINTLGEWALRTACADAAKWPKKLPVSINVSAVQFMSEGFVTTLTHVLSASQIDPSQLVLEITESVFLGDDDSNDQIFRAIKQLGVRLALDDFGTGYSSLAYLSSSPFEKLKIDRKFVETCTERGSKDQAIISATIGLASALKMEVIVEGVEAFDQLDLIHGMGAQLVQGWIYSKALPNDEVLERLAQGDFRLEPDGPKRYRPNRRSVFRMVGLIHGDHRYDAVMRDLSRTGARVEGLLGVPVDTELVLDMGNGQLAVATVVWSRDAVLGLEFETQLINDGAGGLCTRHRVSPYVLAAAGMPLTVLPPGHYPLVGKSGTQTGTPQFMQVQVQNFPQTRVA
ncbi:putative signaling protein [Caenibius tardaugens NBRC 16725]|uniref:Putative signaling protein n=1 Tax=Caenibius tardaugens NBRC 16725 TaxID=1219035 RepID=U2Y554_9SPHN|nr:EAL domain-containing protein [Caenibius tardaugens]AZI34747.1 EAL domain-containing protein [Caenibius tardaugens NBRC 16725]GAD48266.1 putative signaling protein [Caenibius tardaugens NBRC 16725]